MSCKVLYDILCSVKRHINAHVIFRCVYWLTGEIDLTTLTKQITQTRNHTSDAVKEGLPMGKYGAVSSS